MRANGGLFRFIIYPAFATLALAAYSVLLQSEALADDAATREKCTCEIDNGNSARTGSTVVNAAACLRDRIGDWCDTYIAATEDSQAHGAIIGTLNEWGAAGNDQPTVNLLFDLYHRYLGSQAKVYQSYSSRIEKYEGTLKQRIEDNKSSIQSCIANFAKGEIVSIEGDGFSCGVGAQSGWLRITFSLGDGRFSYLFAPTG